MSDWLQYDNLWLIHVAANGIICSFLWLSHIPLCKHTHTHMYHIFFILSSVDGHWGCFHVLAIVNSAAINSGGHISFQSRAFSIYMPGSGISGSYNNSLFSFFPESSYCFPEWLHQFTFPPTVQATLSSLPSSETPALGPNSRFLRKDFWLHLNQGFITEAENDIPLCKTASREAFWAGTHSKMYCRIQHEAFSHLDYIICPRF